MIYYMKKIIRKTNKPDPLKQPSRAKQELKREKQKKALKRVEKKLLAPTPNRSKQLSPTQIKVNKLTRNPIFVEFLNWKGDKFFIENLLERLSDNFESDSDKQVSLDKKRLLNEEDLLNLESFQKVFKRHFQETLSDKAVSDHFLSWLSNSHTYIEQHRETYLNDEIIKLSIKDPSGRWLEAILCSNFIMTFNYFGLDIMKSCPVCLNFFCHKGPYARYCSDGCKEVGMS